MHSYSSLSIVLICLLIAHPVLSQEDDKFTMTPVQTEAFEVMRGFFHYDRSIPLDARIVDHLDHPSYTRDKIVFRGILDSRVPGYLAIPKSGVGPFPCVLMLHGITGSKEDWWTDNSIQGKHLSEELLSAGFAVLSLDAVYHGERIGANDFESAGVFTFEKGWMARARNMIVQSVIEYRRALDYLATRPEIDMTDIGMIGYSMGGMMTFNLSAVESRIKSSVACVMPVLKDQYSAIAVHNFAPRITAESFLMLVGREDEFNYTIDQAEALKDLVASPDKELVIYESGHILPTEWNQKARQWFVEHLK